MPAYSWRCLACDRANEAVNETCENCSCPARATYQQIAAAKQSVGIVKPVDGPRLSEVAVDFWEYFIWKRRDQSAPIVFLYEVMQVVVGLGVVLVLMKAWEFFGR